MTTTTRGTAKVTLPTDLQILITREFNAPKALVWRAYTEPELVKRWWGAGMGEMQSAEIDLRVGGTWRYVQVIPGGAEVAFHGVYREIEAPDRLVNTEVFEGLPDPDAHTGLITVTLAETGGRTLLEMRCEYGDQETRDAIIASGMEVGLQRSLDSLESVAVEL
ncbi:SRPBCC family protein [Dactylosporangium sp. NPDC000244]|uniref:SRPBCC family protein n=1 Tax=Dactylosporangium sp. NPDC000244 TaxID=3154365 RepID=UPI0033227959